MSPHQESKDTKTTAQELEKVTIRFAGDSGDGMQLTGSLFADESALLGNDLATFPDYPAEIRAPAGTVAGVSSFQVQIGSVDIFTPGDQADALIAMNPAALKANLVNTRKGGAIIIDKDNWKEKDLELAECKSDPITDGTLGDYKVIPIALTSLTREALKQTALDTKAKDRCKNLFALGMMFWLYNRPLTNTEAYIKEKFAKKPDIVDANLKVLNAGWTVAQSMEDFAVTYKVAPASITPGLYRQISGNHALALGFVAASVKSGRNLVLGSYPITPASDVLHLLSQYKDYGVVTIQAEDEIAGVGMALGASFAGALAITTTSGPGLDLKSEMIGLAAVAELPLVIVDVQRGGPSTGLPTKTEQSDLLLALYGRHGECPVPVIAASTPSDCFHYAFEAGRIALEHMTPVILLTDGYIANGSEPWIVPDQKALPKIRSLELKTVPEGGYMPYRRDPKTLAREWAVPGTPGMEHRIGGLEKQEITGNVNYDALNHERMVEVRAEKVARINDFIPELKIIGSAEAELLVIGWGGTYGALLTAVTELRTGGLKIALAHFNYLNPLPRNTRQMLGAFQRSVVCELNAGQLFKYLRSLFDLPGMTSYTKVQGQPFMVNELKAVFKKLLNQPKQEMSHVRLA